MVTLHSTESLGEPETLRLAFPMCEFGIGKIITSPSSRDLIAGVVIEPVSVWPDDRGVFFEVARAGKGIISQFPLDTIQVSATFTYPGSIKAFHYHLRQTDCWVACCRWPWWICAADRPRSARRIRCTSASTGRGRS